MREAEIRNWERVEVERSSSEASRTDPAELVYTEGNLARYMDPPADTCYPLEYAYHLLGDVRGLRVLDFGCGNGENTVLLARRGAQVYGMDISHDILKLAEQRLRLNGVTSGVHLFVASAHDVALADESIDVVFGMNILHHLKLPLVAREVHRVLHKGGRAIFEEPVRNSKFVGFVRNLIPYRSPDVSPFERPLTDAELREFASGFSEYSHRAFKLPYINLANVLPGAGRLGKPLYRLDGKLLRSFPSLGYYATTRVVAMVK
ncbi:MAG TPA: methyltransferase domain-containing protein [Pyrinomonadaceae bacterium]|nr:methyltransferase domain-containing protein [Pyrinomonadaceae bacterium]